MRFPTSDAVLNDISTEFKRMNNIDVFNNAWACFYDLRMWVKMGRPQEVRNDMYAASPWVAVMRQRVGRKESEGRDET